MAYKVDYKIVECMQKKNSCYKQGITHKKVGIIRHNTGAGNPYLKRYVDDPERLGKNVYGNHWNQTQTGSNRKMVHYFVGLDKNDVVRIYHIMPDNYVCWGNGSHPKTGKSCNRTHIQYEICEDGGKSRELFEATRKAARYLEAYLCVKYGWSEKVIMSHWESYLKGCGSSHGDDDDQLKKFGTNMNEERAKVKKLIAEMKAKKNNKDDEIKTVTKVDKDENPQVKSYVKGLQQSLNSLGEELEVDSSFGPRTTEAMGRHNVKKGMKNILVKHFQWWLKKAGFYKGEIDSSFGPQMLEATRKAQAKVGVSADGIIGSGSAKAFMKLFK